MKTFDEMMELTKTINCEGVYSNVALKGLYDAAVLAPPVGNFVEIGCEYGRSTSLIAQVAKERNQYLVCIDPFVKHLSGAEGAGVGAHTFGMLCKLNLPFSFLFGHSFNVPYNFGPISFLHVDGNHSVPFLRSDLDRFFPLVVDGGYIALHDYGNDGPYSKDVKTFLDDRDTYPLWERIGDFDTCLVMKRIGPYESYYVPWGGRP
jgi:SAM-dependent methyltransferase